MIHLDILAGRMSFDGKKVSPDARKGILRLSIDVESDLVKIQWLDRSQEPPSVEFEMLAPVTIEPVPSVKTGRVYVIKSNLEKNFVWIQQQASGNAAGDAAGLASGSVDNVESLINQIQMFAQIPSGRAAAEMYSQIFGDEEEDQIQEDQMLVDLRHHHLPPDDEADDDAADEEEFQALMEQLVGEGQLSTDQIAQLLLVNPEIQQILIAQFVQMAANFLALNPAAIVETPPSHHHPVEMRDILINEKALDLLSSDKEVENRLLALCPPHESSLREVILSPQFGEALRSLTEGIYSDQISLLFHSLGLDPSAIAPNADPLEALCRALESKFAKPSPHD